MKILIVDDNPQVRRLLCSVLQRGGGGAKAAVAIIECADGCDARGAYEAHRPDWVLMDIEMKKMDGIAATRQIKADFPEARILIVTNYDNAVLRETALEAGASGYVTKDNLLDLPETLYR